MRFMNIFTRSCFCLLALLLPLTNTNAQSLLTPNQKNLNINNPANPALSNSQEKLPLTNYILKLAASEHLNVIIEPVIAFKLSLIKVDPAQITTPALITLKNIISENKLNYTQIDRRTIMLYQRERQAEPFISLEDLLARADRLDSSIGNSAPAREFIRRDYNYQQATLATVLHEIGDQEHLKINFDSTVADLIEKLNINFKLKNVTAPRAIDLLLRAHRFVYQHIGPRTILILPEANIYSDFSRTLEEIITRAEEDESTGVETERRTGANTKTITGNFSSNGEDIFSKAVQQIADKAGLNVIFDEKATGLTFKKQTFLFDNISPLRAVELLIKANDCTYAQIDRRTIMVIAGFMRSIKTPAISLTEMIAIADKLDAQSGGTHNGPPQKRYDFSFQEVALDIMIQNMAEKANLNVLYESAISKLIEVKRVSFQIKNVTATEALISLLNSQRFTYAHIDRRTIMLAPESLVSYIYSQPIAELLQRADEQEQLTANRPITGKQLSLDKFEINEKNISIYEIIRKLAAARRLEVRFDNNAEAILKYYKLDIHLTGISPMQVLQSLLAGYNLHYVQLDRRTINVYKGFYRLLEPAISLEKLAARADRLDHSSIEPVKLKQYDLNFEKTPAKEIFYSISEKERLNIIFDDAINKLLEVKKVSFASAQVNVPTALNQLFQQLNLCYNQLDSNTILISPADESNCGMNDSLEGIIQKLYEDEAFIK